jgi:hypothetical protein
MTEECRNDCLDRLLFPKRLDVNLNRPGLSRIDYRIGTYADIREALLRHLNLNPILTSWTHREADDPGIALLEGAAILGDILTFYQDLYANEAYLRTAQWRESVADLVRLVGYRLSPGVGGRAIFAVEVKGEKPLVIPKGFPIKAQLEGLEKQTEFETQRETVAYPKLSKFNLYRRLFTPPSINENTNEFYIVSPDQYTMPLSIEKGDRILIGDISTEESKIRLLNSETILIKEIRKLHGITLFKIRGYLKKRTESRATVVGYKLGRSFRHFGHNAPQKIVSIINRTSREDSISYRRSVVFSTSSGSLALHDDDVPPKKRVVDPDLLPLDFPVASEVGDLTAGNQFIIQGSLLGLSLLNLSPVAAKEFTFVRTINGVKTISMTWGGISGTATIVSLEEQKLITNEENCVYNTMDIRTVEFHEVVSPQLQLRSAVEEVSLLQGKDLYFYGTETEVRALKGRQLLFEKLGEELFTANVVSVQILPPDVSDRLLLRRITLDQEVNYADFPNQNPTVTVYGNLVPATQGKTEREAALGNGDSREIFQTFKLPKAPLTYFIAAEETPPEVPELEIFVNDRLWQRVPSFFGHGPKEEIYIVREDDNEDSWVQFGDGKTGARLPSGIKNVMAKYRTGIGAQGPLKAGTTPQAGGRLDRLKKVYLPGAATGGDQPETGDNAKAAAPGKVQSLGRLVSLQDFETEILGVPGVTKASAQWGLIENTIPAVVLTVLMKSGGSDEEKALRDLLTDYNRERGPNRFPIDIRFGKQHYVYLTVTVARDPTYRGEIVKKAIKEALGVTGDEVNGVDGSEGLFSLARRQFSQPEYATRIQGVIQNVEGVVWVTVNAFGAFEAGEEALTLNAPTAGNQAEVVHATATSLDEAITPTLLRLHTQHLQLNLPVVDATEVPSHG